MWNRGRTTPRLGAILLAMMSVLTASPGVLLPAHAEPTVMMAWDTCNPSNFSYDEVTRELTSDGQLQIWVLGQELGSQAYSFDLEFRNPEGAPLADAWRYDPDGCQAESLLSFLFRNPHPTGQSCGLGLSEHSSVHTVVFENQYDPSTRRARIHVEVHYSPATTTTVPNVRYRLARLYFFQAPQSVFGSTKDPGECGGLEQGVCFRITDARYQNAAGEWIPWAIDTTPVTAHGEGTPVPECAGIPVRPTTWGAVKATYR